ncbi:MAG: hypothetical protein CL763_02880 [Chloroflexi bacterium]|nr:hypothetical protein [Chloroflexota bacterium]MQF86818.1 hypothetical protein [SAR202 cluster bacterium]
MVAAFDSQILPADRNRLLITLATPFILLLLSSLVAWPWRALDLPGTFGSLTPPSFLLLIATVAGSTFALRRRLPLSMITWLPAGQGAIVLLATGFFTGDEATVVTAIAFLIAYVLIYLIVLVISVVISNNGGQLGISFMSFFILTQAARFPIFEIESTVSVSWSSLFTFLAALISICEIFLVIWLARRIVEADDRSSTQAVLMLVGLVLLHGVVASWQDPLLRGSIGFSEMIEQSFRWLMLIGIQLGMCTVLIRFRIAHIRQEAQRLESLTQGPHPNG